MQIIKSRLAILSHDPEVLKNFSGFEPLELSLESENFEISEIEILLLDLASIQLINNLKDLIRARQLERIKKIILVFKTEDIVLPTELYNSLQPDLVKAVHQLEETDIVHLSTEIQQTAQNNAYVELAHELNVAYEKIKFELENRIHDKTKHLIESRRKIFEINHRIEFLRKALYTISEIRTLSTAEEKLNELLTTYNKVTWLKIVPEARSQEFESQIQTHFESSLFQTEVRIQSETYLLYFLKGDRKPFKKSDILLFKKLGETLQINLARIENLGQLQRNESFFDLAFHSSKNPILVLDQNYMVHQANKAALARAQAGQIHCYEILFNRSSKCVGCVLGKDFQIQEENSFYNVHSQPLSLMELEDTQYWVHVYEDSTEKNLYEKKITQFARLEELGLISSSIAHELNNPLGGILSFLQIMKMELPVQHHLLSDLNMMHDTALRMKKIVEDLLIFSRSHHELVLEDLDIYHVTQNILSKFDLQFKVEKIKVSFLPPSEGAVFCRLSKTMFQDTVNLILQFFLQRAQAKKTNRQNFTSLVEVKITHDQINYYLSFASNLGPLENEFKTKDLNLLAIEKTLTDQGFQLFISEPAKDWIQLSVLISRELTARS